MLEIEKSTSACFTGHRTYPAEKQTEIILKTDETVNALYKRGYRVFIAGGAIGFDTLAACRVVIAKRTHPDIKLLLALPCRNQTEKWPSGNQLKLYKYLLGAADDVVYTSQMYEDGCMALRNKYMVDHSSVCVAYYTGSHRGGTSSTVKYAVETGCEVINVADMLE